LSTPDYSDEDFQLLAEMLCDGNGLFYSIDLSRYWIANYLNNVPDGTIRNFLALPLDQVPLHINDSDPYLPILARWRLKIAR